MMNKINKIPKLLLVILILLGYYFLNIYFHFSIPCMFYKLTNLYCPGCGITRMLFSLIKLDFYQSFRYNPLVFILLFVYLIFKMVCILENKNIKIPEYVYYIILVILIIYGILRNTNIPFGIYLRPTLV